MSTGIIYVFGSNLAARFISDEQRFALRWHGVNPRITEGPTAQAYALPLWDKNLAELPDQELSINVKKFFGYAERRSDLLFEVPRIGSEAGPATERKIARLFLNCPANCRLPGAWEQLRKPGLLRLWVVARWPGLSGLDYQLIYSALNHYLPVLKNETVGQQVIYAVYGKSSVWMKQWADKEGIDIHEYKEEFFNHGQHASTVLHGKLMMACTEVLALESRSIYIEAILKQAKRSGIKSRLIKRVQHTDEHRHSHRRIPVANAPAEKPRRNTDVSSRR